MMKVLFKKRYFIPFLLVLVCEIAIAIFHFHRFVRGFLGDVLVIPLLYFLLRAFLTITHKSTIYVVLGFAFIVEILQLFKLSEIMNINSEVLETILGNTFDWKDLLAYGLGAFCIHLVHVLTAD